MSANVDVGRGDETSAPRPAAGQARRVASAVRGGREAGIDALRATLTLLVLFHHAAITYGAIGGWYYREVPTDGRLETKLLIFFCTVNQAYFMGLFFLLAGYFTPAGVARYGAFGYLKERLLRLGLPLLVYAVAIGPLTIALAQTAKGRSFGATLLRLWRGSALENGPLWFAQALLIFTLAYLAWRALWPRRRAPPQAQAPAAFPSNLALAAAAGATGLAAFNLRLIWPVGVQVFGLQLGYFASYVVLFAVGCIAASPRWLEQIPDRQRRLWLAVAWLALPILPAVVVLAPHLPALRGDTSGGFNVQAAVYAFWEPLVAWGFILAFLHGFQRRFVTLGPIWAALARRAYAIYIIHPPVLVAIALAWRDAPAPHLLKFALTGAATCLACFWIAGLLVRAPWVRKIV
jgi:peptidoglycan/LPS O-acetylase OafA/YrhL